MYATIIWAVCFISVIIIPIMSIVLGKIFRDNPPKEINRWKGYRTSRSMASQEAWDFANYTMGKRMFILGLWMLGITIVVHCLFIKASMVAISIETVSLVIAQSVASILITVSIEKLLKERF